MQYAIKQLILTGLHKSGKTTFINKLLNNDKTHQLSYNRLNMIYTLKNCDKFSLSTYMNSYQIYDRHLLIDPFVYFWELNEQFLYDFYSLVKPYFKDTLVYIALFDFEESIWGNTKWNKQYYQKIYEIMKSLNYNVIAINNSTDFNKFVNHFDNNYIFKQLSYDKSIDDLTNETNHEFSWTYFRLNKLLSKKVFDQVSNKYLKPFYYSLQSNTFRELDKNKDYRLIILSDYTKIKDIHKHFSRRFSHILFAYYNVYDIPDDTVVHLDSSCCIIYSEDNKEFQMKQDKSNSEYYIFIDEYSYDLCIAYTKAVFSDLQSQIIHNNIILQGAIK